MASRERWRAHATMARVAPGSANELLQFAEPLMDEDEEPPSPAPRPERAQSEASILRDRDALADMTAEEALRVAAEEGIELETSDRLSVTGYVGVFLNHPGNRRQFQLQMSGSGSARQCVGSFSSAEAAALCKARIELEPDGLTHVIVRKVLGKLVETTARAVEHELGLRPAKAEGGSAGGRREAGDRSYGAVDAALLDVKVAESELLAPATISNDGLAVGGTHERRVVRQLEH